MFNSALAAQAVFRDNHDRLLAIDQPGNLEQSSKSEMNNSNSMIDADSKSNKASVIPSRVMLEILAIFAALNVKKSSPEMHFGKAAGPFRPTNRSKPDSSVTDPGHLSPKVRNRLQILNIDFHLKINITVRKRCSSQRHYTMWMVSPAS